MKLTLIFIIIWFSIQNLLGSTGYWQNPGKFRGKIVSEVIKEIPDGSLIKHLASYFHPTGTTFTRESLERSIKLLYLTGRFSNIEVRAGKIDNSSIQLIYKLIPTKRVQRVILKGNSRFSTWTLSDQILINPGEPLETAKLTETRRKILKLYREEGFKQCKITPRTQELPGGRFVVTFDIREGTPTVVKTVTFVGTPHLSKYLYSIIRVRRGSILSQKKLLEDREAIITLLKKHHYNFAIVSDPTISIDEIQRFKEKKNDIANITWHIKKGARAMFIFRSADPFMSDLFSESPYGIQELLSSINLNQYPTINNDVLTSIDRSIEAFFREKGLIDTKVQHVKKFDKVKKIPEFVFLISEGKLYTYDIRITGTRQLNHRNLVRKLKDSSLKLLSGIFNEKDIKDNIKVITNHYRSLGYLKMKFEEEPLFIYDKKKSSVTVFIRISEGKKTIIRSIRFAGAQKGDQEALLSLTTLSPGMGLDPFQIDNFIGVIEHFYRKRGYYYAKANTQDVVSYSEDSLVVDLLFTVDPGPRSRIGKIILSGNYITHDRIIHRELSSHYLRLEEGDFYNPETIQRTREKISATGVFQSVSIVPFVDPEYPERIDLIIKMVEKAPGLLKFGVGYKNERGIRISGSIINDNLWGMNRTAYLKAELNQKVSEATFKEGLDTEYLFQIGFIEPWLFNSRQKLLENLIFKGNFFWERRDTESFRIDRRQNISVGLEKKLSRYGNIKLSYQYERDVGFNKTENQNLKNVFATISPALTLDHRDNAFNPTSGLYNIVATEYDSTAFGSSFHFFKIWSHSNIYFPVFKQTVLAISLRGGAGRAFSNDETGKRRIPLLSRFFLGGRGTVRGYSQDSLGPKSPINNRPLGGERSFNYQVELRRAISGFFGIVFFLDGGNVYLKGYPYTIRHSWGPGLRYLTPIGPISFEYGIKINPEPGEPSGAIHFSIGMF